MSGPSQWVRVELDAVQPYEFFDEHANEWSSEVYIKLVQQHGPGGGHPLIALVGPQDEVELFIKDHWGDDEALFQGIQPLFP